MDGLDSRTLAQHFVQAWNERDVAAMERLFHPDFTWHIAVTDHGDPKVRPLQSNLFAGKNIPWDKAIYDKNETIKIFSGIFEGTAQFSLEPRSFTAEGNRVAVELVGNARNDANGRQYDNLYCYILEILDGQIVLFREYQDTLLLFDVWVAR